MQIMPLNYDGIVLRLYTKRPTALPLLLLLLHCNSDSKLCSAPFADRSIRRGRLQWTGKEDKGQVFSWGGDKEE